MGHLLPRGARLGRYEVQVLIGSGGAGEVYRARDTLRDRLVAIKVLASAITTDPAWLGRFTSEARATALINHPNLVSVDDVGSEGGRRFVVSELLEGETLRVRMRRGRLPAEIAMTYGLDIAHGLIAAHHLGVVHRDLKPENVFVTAEGHLKILDFGLSRCGPETAGVWSGGEPSSEPGTIPGTVGYMSPEQVHGGAVDERSDIFSFGAILYEMIAGAPPFQRETPLETLYAIMKRDPPPLAPDAGITADLEHVIRHCLEKSAAARFQSARDLAFVLEFTLRAADAARRPVPVRRLSVPVVRTL